MRRAVARNHRHARAIAANNQTKEIVERNTMCRIVFECVDREGRPFTVNMESDNDAINGLIAEWVEASRRGGVEVISASGIEEMPIDLDLHAAPARRPVIVKQKWNRFLPTMPALPARMFSRAATFGGLLLSIIGFDDGFSAASFVAHVEKLVPAVGRMIHAIV